MRSPSQPTFVSPPFHEYDPSVCRPAPGREAAQRGPTFDVSGSITVRADCHHSGDGDPLALSAPHQRHRRGHPVHLRALRAHDVNLP
jgi:hypothetical protein